MLTEENARNKNFYSKNLLDKMPEAIEVTVVPCSASLNKILKLQLFKLEHQELTIKIGCQLLPQDVRKST